jgi:hypothetical protein
MQTDSEWNRQLVVHADLSRIPSETVRETERQDETGVLTLSA